MIDYFEKNIGALRRRNPELADLLEGVSPPAGSEVIRAKNGEWALVRSGVTFHSRIDPGAEARKMSEAALDAARKAGKNPGFFGLGLGWHVLALAALVEEVLVVEPDPGMIRLALTYLDFTSRMPKIRFVWQTGQLESTQDLVLTPHAPTARVHRKAWREWSDFFGRVSQPVREPAGRVKNRLRELPELAALVDGLDEDTALGLEDLVGVVRRNRGLLTEGEIYVLLLKELAV